MTATEKDLSLMKVHVFKTVDEYEAARSDGLIGGDDLVITPDTGAIDGEMSDTSTNTVQNRVIKAYVDSAIAAAIASLNE
ncbi:MAG: hypothetical protein SPL16_01590 [Eubacteriales bacterium]|nr:hypothetical protein [Eubacteriales bacterium]MDD5809943.1 hypothetical protein [Clostridiales bacterium]MDD6839543.1 hypothetical protein [Clostridiales bacterium]MDD7444439.1 hypothetical protein [Clostridiales bacterium]MDD7494302.1 hypothetical protein [Clostridiales bacterium]